MYSCSSQYAGLAAGMSVLPRPCIETSSQNVQRGDAGTAQLLWQARACMVKCRMLSQPQEMVGATSPSLLGRIQTLCNQQRSAKEGYLQQVRALSRCSE
jgi:hypothetical protein